MSLSCLFISRIKPQNLCSLTVAIVFALAEEAAGAGFGLTDAGGRESPAGWMDFFLVAILLCIDLLIIRSLYTGFEGAIRKVRRALVALTASLLVILLWAVLGLVSAGTDGGEPVGPGSYGWVAVVTGALAASAIVLRFVFFPARPTSISMSPSSKMVWHKGEWISIEAYLTQVMGISITHAMTAEEKEEALRRYQEEIAKSGVPRPSHRE
jgi:hypothetical protein